MVNGGAAQQLDSKGGEVRGLDEFLHAPTWKVTELEPEAVESKLGTAPCKGLQCVDTKKNGGFETRLTAVARLDDRAPFGVVTYEYEKDRLRDGQSLGKRTMTLTLSDFGRDAVSDLPDNR